MDTLPEFENVGLFDDRYRAFLETIVQVRPRLHRYCARMLGSAMDGEDLVQDALFQAYRKLDSFDDSRPLTPWLFRIAHNLASMRCAAAGCGWMPNRARRSKRRFNLPNRPDLPWGAHWNSSCRRCRRRNVPACS